MAVVLLWGVGWRTFFCIHGRANFNYNTRHLLADLLTAITGCSCSFRLSFSTVLGFGRMDVGATVPVAIPSDVAAP